jgi:hypothetical protein
MINEDEFLLLYDVNVLKYPEYPYWSYETFCLKDKDEVECKAASVDEEALAAITKAFLSWLTGISDI